MSRHEQRKVNAAEVRVPDEGGRTFEAVVLRYNVVDDYDTRFVPGVFTESLEARLPRICWAHRWDEPLGRYVDYKDTDEGLTLVGEFDDFDAVPRARQAHAQLRSGTIDQFSVGFVRTQDRPADKDDAGREGVTDIVRGILDEASLVLVGAVPGTSLVSVRQSFRSGVMMDDLVEIAKRKASGELTAAEAEEALLLLAGDTPDEPAEDDDTDDGGGPDPEAVAEAEAEADRILAELED